MIKELLEPFKESLLSRKAHYGYGTAGFRARYTADLHPLFLTVGVLTALRSISLGGRCVGVMVTASHNEEHDNGVKIVDYDGGMLVKDWEVKAEEWVNITRVEDLAERAEAELQRLLSMHSEVVPVVMIGMDTRSHSPLLAELVAKGAQIIPGSKVLHMGEVITPVLHFAVFAQNTGKVSPCSDFERATVMKCYFDTLWEGYQGLLSLPGNSARTSSTEPQRIVLDAARGVGSITVQEFLTYTTDHGHQLYPWALEVRNPAHSGPVNDSCGAEHCQKLLRPPIHVSAAEDRGVLLASFDGDGDRIVFHCFRPDSEDAWVLLDGDRIACVVAAFLQRLMHDASLEGEPLSFGVVQTAYANGASSHYLRGLGIPVTLAKTGVKFLHHAAVKLDVGVYFEANGHGTVLFSQKFRERLTATLDRVTEDGPRRTALLALQSCLSLINPTVGDAFSDLLCVLAILTRLQWTVETWRSLFTDLPARQTKVAVRNKQHLRCTDDETRLTNPEALQQELDSIVSRIAGGEGEAGRCFVRPSGTEDVVRIYAEASTSAAVDAILAAVEEAVQRHCQ